MMKRIKDLWHDLYYKYSPSCGVKFAMTCKEAAEQINSAESGRLKMLFWLRLKLHLSLCRACAYYQRGCITLKNAAKNLAKNPENTIDIDKLNSELLEKYSRH